MGDISEFPTEVRATRYRELAGIAQREAQSATGLAGETYLILAKQWEHLALQVERASLKFGGVASIAPVSAPPPSSSER